MPPQTRTSHSQSWAAVTLFGAQLGLVKDLDGNFVLRDHYTARAAQ